MPLRLIPKENLQRNLPDSTDLGVPEEGTVSGAVVSLALRQLSYVVNQNVVLVLF